MRTVSLHFAILLALPLMLGACSHPSGLGQLAGMASAKPSLELATGLRIAEATRNGGDNQAAITLYRQIVAAHPTSPLPLLGLGDALYEGRAFDEAIAAYQAALRLDTGNPDAQVGIGRVNLARNLPGEALAAFDRALADAPQHAAALNGRGVALDLMGMPEEARAMYRQVQTLQPGNRGARNNLALSMLLAGDKEQAIPLFRELSAERSAGQERIRQNLALALGMSGRMDAAAEVARMDLSPEAVKENLAYYAMLRSLDRQADGHAAIARAVNASGT
ncbi:tetratricopeptide repeat protein (plasmid) [Azospirillum brasilense]|uniref:Tetratricopeptide repeat protein n=1 Tax=Azospirillum brasilense TaxID=192 RepID=A0A4D8R199_AZOBR|nr:MULTISPECIES: tetratricopeptide repeat protein [Azospirillum]MDW7555499.1 tetratricopeptide repeat protein [Azospirillum brasilense]MDW7595093.1 tetratricopeptide repeat protein [Azospirillum brasilense]MDW7630246.1 tetratricopeptide repeat protein [Azospirillum brasilense]MDX5949614.1 tetratricopeptide repeat protein [Azospirillum brasilense]OPH12193.1 hypothetical protein FE89_29365 [Azospirillum brasilense]